MLYSQINKMLFSAMDQGIDQAHLGWWGLAKGLLLRWRV